MIITRTPLRISFVGGGSDMPAYFNEETGAVVSASIDKYVYVTVAPSFSGRIRAAYRQIEEVDNLDDLQHDLMRETLRWFKPHGGIEIHSIADVPGGTGLGSSSAFTVGLVRARAAYVDQSITTRGCALLACDIEIGRCKHPIGVQDQYAAAFGGINLMTFARDLISVQPIACDANALSQHTLLLYTGQARNGTAGERISAQQQDRDDVRTLVNAAIEFRASLEHNNLEHCGGVLHWTWNVKRKYASTPQIDQWYAQARQAGAWGGKLCGAGGGGFLVFLAPPERHAAIVQATGLRHVPVRLGVAGCEVIHAN